MGDIEQASSEFNSAIELDSQYANAYITRGESLIEIGENQRAISDLEKALELGLPLEFQERAEELTKELGL
ncbi:hypothetical protein ACFLY4_00610 [Chloroflexota bacterium]